MYKAQLRLDLGVEYPENHDLSNTVGHYFIVRPEDVQKIAKFTIACVELNGGKCWISKETLRIRHTDNLYGLEFEEINSEVIRFNHLFDSYEDHNVVKEVVFRGMLVDLDYVEQLWNKINKEEND